MDFVALKAELSARGFARLGDTRLGTFINEGRQRLDNAYPWPYRLATASGASPLTIADLGTIEEVADTGQSGSPSLSYADRRSLRDSYGDITKTGTPGFFFIDNGVVRTYPSGGTLSVRYYKRTPALSGSSDTPLAPTDYHMLIVDLAEQEARARMGDWQTAQALQGQISMKLGEMAGDLLGGQQTVGSDLVPVSWDSLDG